MTVAEGGPDGLSGEELTARAHRLVREGRLQGWIFVSAEARRSVVEGTCPACEQPFRFERVDSGLVFSHPPTAGDENGSVEPRQPYDVTYVTAPCCSAEYSVWGRVEHL